MKSATLVSFLVAFIILGVNSSVNAAYAPPLPGELLVSNGFSPELDGGCAGNLSVSHSPRSTDLLGRVVLQIHDDCTVEVAWQDAGNAVPQGQPTHYSVQTDFMNMTSNSYVSLNGFFNHSLNKCPHPVPGGATIAQSPTITPGILRSDGSVEQVAPTPFGPEETLSECKSGWLQYWTPLDSSSSVYPLYVVKAVAIQVGGEGILHPYTTYQCLVNGKTNQTDSRVHCTRWPESVPQPEEWGASRTLGSVAPSTDRVLYDEISIV